MNYRQLQAVLRDIRDNFNYPLCCKLSEKKEVLQAVYDRYLERNRACPINSRAKPHNGFDCDIAQEYYTCGIEQDYIDTVQIEFYGIPYTVTFSNVDAYQSASFQAIGLKHDGQPYSIQPMLSCVRSDREMMDLAWDKLENSRKAFYPELALHYELPRPKTPINYTVQFWAMVSSYREIFTAYFETVQFQILKQGTSEKSDYNAYRLAMLCELQVETSLDVYYGVYTQKLRFNRTGWILNGGSNWLKEIGTLINT